MAMRAAYALVLAWLSAAAIAEIPHEFQPGTPARAAEVNENFAALMDAIEARERGFQLVDNRGRVAGPVLYFSDGFEAGVLASVEIPDQGFTRTLLVFRPDLPIVSGHNVSLVFATSDCAGRPYIKVNRPAWDSLGLVESVVITEATESESGTSEVLTGRAFLYVVGNGQVMERTVSGTATHIRPDGSFVCQASDAVLEDVFQSTNLGSVEELFPSPHHLVRVGETP